MSNKTPTLITGKFKKVERYSSITTRFTYSRKETRNFKSVLYKAAYINKCNIITTSVQQPLIEYSYRDGLLTSLVKDTHYAP